MPVVAAPQRPERTDPKKVLSAKSVELVLISYADESGFVRTQLALVGDNNVHLLDSRPFGISREPTPQGVANSWLRDGVFEKLGKKAEKKVDA